MNGAVALRPARTADAPTMAALSRTLIETGLGWRYTPQRIGALMADEETAALVACDDSGAVQGFAVMQFADDSAHLVLLCVRTAQQRRGIGMRLIEWLLQSARVAGIARIHVELRADNAGAFAFYRRLGFVETRVLHGYYGGVVDARCMALELQAGLSQA